MPQSDYFPPGAYNFSINIDGGSDEGPDALFQEVKGISMKLKMKAPVEQVGVTETRHEPEKTEYTPLVLKRGLLTIGSDLVTWCMESIQEFKAKPIRPKDITVNLLDDTGDILMSWSFTDAIPIEWTMSDFNAQQNGIVTESMSFVYSSFRIV
ncbi:MAG: phage tail protein [Bacteroidota bacterium]